MDTPRFRPGRRKRAEQLFGPEGTPRVAIIGAGLGGLGLAVHLLRAGIRTFTIFEKNEGPGGTWWENTYPGAAVDAESHLYCFSFRTHNWSRTFAEQRELLEYIQGVVRDYGLDQQLRLATKVTDITWSDDEHVYTLWTADGGREQFHVVVSAVGLLNYVSNPNWPGLEDFNGPQFHAARWDHGVDLKGKRVAVIGTGSTGAQIVPSIAPDVARLYVFQREPGHVLRKGDRPYSQEELVRFTSPAVRRLERVRLYKKRWALRRRRVPLVGSRANRRWERAALDYIEDVFRDRPDLAAAVTPQYPFYGKRPIESDDFYPALLRENVELVPHAVHHLTETGIVDSQGIARDVDVIVSATGFQPANYLASIKVHGRAGKSIHDAWNGEPRAFFGVTVPDFPNFYMIFGPNTNGGEILFYEEQQAKYALRSVKRMIKEGVTAIEVRDCSMEWFNTWLQRRLRGSAFGRTAGGGYRLGYYRSPTGTIVTQWNQGLTLYWLGCRLLPRIASVATRKEGRVTREEAAGVKGEEQTRRPRGEVVMKAETCGSEREG